MSLRADVVDSMFLTEGRLLDAHDYENANPVAVIRAEFAALRNLQLGDTLIINMREETFATEYIIPDTRRIYPAPQAGERMNWETFLKERHGGNYGLALTSTFHDFRGLEGSFPANRPFFPGLPPEENTWVTGNGALALGPITPFIDGIAHGDVLYVDFRGVDEIMNLEMATGYIIDSDYGWRDRETYEVTVEIVGIYATLDSLSNFVTLSHNNVYVPDSIVPSHWTQDALYRNFTFNLNSPADEEEFIRTYHGAFEEMGFWPSFLESGWDDFAASTTTILSGILIRVLAFGLLVFVVYYLVTFLYFLRGRKDFAISRALGIEKKSALWGIMLPMFLMTILGIVAGGLLAWYFAISRAEITLQEIEGAVFTHPPTYWLWVVIGLLFILIAITCGNEARRLAGYSELELLQGNVNSKARKKRKNTKKSKIVEKLLVSMDENEELQFEIIEIELDKKSKNVAKNRESISNENEKAVGGWDSTSRGIGGSERDGEYLSKTKSFSDIESFDLQSIPNSEKRPMIITHFIRTVSRYIIRKPFKSAIAVSVALGFISILSLIPVSIMENNRQIDWLYDNTVVAGNLIVDPSSGIPRQGSISHRLLRNITELKPYEEYSQDVDALVVEDNVLTNEEIEYFVASYNAEARHSVAIESLGESPEARRMTVLEASWANILGFNNLITVEEFHDLDFSIEYMGGFDATIFENVNNEGVIFVSHDFREELGVNPGDFVMIGPADMGVVPHESLITVYQVVGFFERPGGFPQLITPLENLQDLVGDALRYDRVEFGLNTYFNRELELFEESMDELLANTEPTFIYILHDHILRGVVEPLEQNVAMMEALYPIIFVLAIIIAMVLTILLLLPGMKDMAVMRTLGVTKTGVAVVLGLEQMVLCVMGLMLGILVSMIAFGWSNILGALLYLAGSVLAGIVFCIVLANRKPLELLQVKE
jgi:hypothetical protein